jgi:ribosomal protein S18 acetylase RimI-like enzyme
MLLFSRIIFFVCLLFLQTAVHSWSSSSTGGFLLSRTQEQRTLQLYSFFGNYDDNDGDQKKQQQPQPRDDDAFFIRKSLRADVGRASKILADGFFKGKTNIFIYQLERLETYLSLESGFPKPNTMHEIFVACNALDGIVLAMAEVDARVGQYGDGRGGKDGPYMCNLAVDESCQRRGIASALVAECEAQVLEWYNLQTTTSTRTTPISRSLYLNVLQSNVAAVQMYNKLGYQSFRQKVQERSGETVLVMRKELLLVSSATTASTTTTTTVVP